MSPALAHALARINREIPQAIFAGHKSSARRLLRGEPCVPSPRAMRIATRFMERFEDPPVEDFDEADEIAHAAELTPIGAFRAVADNGNAASAPVSAEPFSEAKP